MAALIERRMDEQGENPISDPILTTREAAAELGVHERTLRR